MAAIPVRMLETDPEFGLRVPRRSEDPAFAGIASGDVAALRSLLDQFWTPLTAYASRVLNDADGADDVVQEVFVTVWAKRREWKPGSARGLLFALTRNAALDELRRRGSRARVAWGSAHDGPRVAQPPSEVLERQEVARLVDEAIQELPRRRREVFDLVYLRGLSYHEVAHVMGISVKTVGNQMTGALRQLRQALQPAVGQAPYVEHWVTTSYAAARSLLEQDHPELTPPQ